jgi:hypothetical protein
LDIHTKGGAKWQQSQAGRPGRDRRASNLHVTRPPSAGSFLNRQDSIQAKHLSKNQPWRTINSCPYLHSNTHHLERR